jgi:hypothetical protein
VPTSVKRLAIAATVLACSLVCASGARADGDPAGDVLAQQPVFYGSALDLKSKEAAQLWQLVADAKAAGYELRVAALSVQQDLGAIDYMWDDPINYSEFLAAELAYVYRRRTLVAMPSGYAVWWWGHTSARDNKVLSKLAGPGEDPAAVLPGVMDAIIALARARGIKLSIPDVDPSQVAVQQPASHYQQAASGSTPAPTSGRVRSNRPPAAAGTTGTGTWLVAAPVGALILVAVALITRARLRERRVPQ